MKNIIKKISAVAMAFALLGTGTVISKKASPESVKPMTAQALCQYHTISNAYWIRPVPHGYLMQCKCCKQYYIY